ncbi:hypothetical protein conserved [Entamoeba histolytica]|uniref:Uncharacterized protein n=2 Tax=Entamoeba histolytica TaxID=5759 RepID=C4LUH4_ENTH1|nr:hypothetical protein, conserved [Entamoeba histolytica HM-1:IMSS]EAL51752.1 hypothetical protein, conserved [Entamoeba histolytica HM-1:IMSS]GAT92262.1 hypothetical protein conserved [Entamoeba histolytica]|eukprot:XP_657137.1 hypothetical protein, conserved [Entamoeba histolytica HM-1:IMSS]
MWVILVLLVAILSIIILLLMFQFIDPLKTKWYVTFFVFLGWGMSFAIPILLPIDISSSLFDKCVEQQNKVCDEPFTYVDKKTLVVLWNLLYWGTTILCWTAIPFLQSYCSAGDFHVLERIKTSLRENIIFYLVVGFVCGVFLILFLIWNENGDWLGIAIAAANAWGLIMVIGMMGYGIVAVPARLIKNISSKHYLNSLYSEINDLTEEHEEEEGILSELITLVKKADEIIPITDPMRKCVLIIINEIDPKRYEATEPSRDFVKSYENLSELHANIQFQQLKVKQIFYTLHSNVDQVLKYESINNKKAPLFQRIYFNVIKKIVSVIALILFIIYSLTVFSSELLLPFNLPILSPLYYIIQSIESSAFLLLIVITVFVIYIAWCVYQTLISMKLFDYYQLFNNRLSDPGSMLFSAAYLCRLCAPLALNILHMIKFDGVHFNGTQTAFQSVMSSMEDIPFFGQNSFNDFFPVCIVIVSAFSLLNHFIPIPLIFNSILKFFGVRDHNKLTTAQKIKRGKYISQIFYTRYADYMFTLNASTHLLKQKDD